MATDLQTLKQQLFSSWTYLDVLALALARTEKRRFTADPTKGNRLIFELQERFERSAPELFQDVYFDLRRPSMPYSQQVESF